MKSTSRIGRIMVAVMSAALAFLPPVEAQRQKGRLLTVEEVKQLPAKTKRFALVIGVDEYQDMQISRLSGATNDAKSLANALVRYAGFPQDQVILLASEVTLGGLVKYLQEQVPKRIQLDLGQEKSQKPYATVGGYKADELVISITVRITPDKSVVSTVDAVTLEYELWNAIKESKDPEDYQAYLKEYPNGRFAGGARNRIRQLEAAAKAASPAVNPLAINPTGPQPASSGAGKQENVDLQPYTETAGSAAIEMVRVPSGKFTMGSPDSETGGSKAEGPQRGSWINDALDVRSANRGGLSPSFRFRDLGFRLVRTYN
jgi:hypothetical protein